MKKSAILTAVASLTLAVAAEAATYKFDLSGTEAVDGFVAAYDESGKLCAVQRALISDGKADITGSPVFDNAAQVKLFPADGTKAVDGVLDATPSPAPTAEPVISTFPEAYSTEAQAYSAPAMVKSIKTDYIDNETVYRLTLLFWGEEKEFTFNSDFIIAEASDEYADAVGQNASYLKNGDVILLGYAFKTHPNDMCLLYRPKKSEPIKMQSFLPLYTTANDSGVSLAGGKWSVGTGKEIGYSFGVVTKAESRYFTLMQADGLERNYEEIVFSDNTIVCGYDVSNTKSADVIGIGGIYESDLSPQSIDSDGNITWNAGDARCYALVRTIDGIAADVMFFDGY